jgi:cytochrome P450
METNDMYAWFRTMRESKPISFNKQHNEWAVFGYDDVQRVLSDYSTFSSEYMGTDNPIGSSIISTDPPRHRQLRSLVTQAFTPRTVAQLTPRITAIVNELLDGAAPSGRMDVIDDLAYPLPVIVIAELLGIPAADRERFKYWSDVVVGAAPSGGRNPQMEMGQYFLQMIEQRRQEPADDLISALLDAQVDGQHLNQLELLGFCILLLVAGNETTTNLIGNAILCFDEQPEVIEQLRAEPALLPNAIEEVLRYRSPIKMMFRVATTDTDLNGYMIKEGQGLEAWIASANRDEAQFPDAERFDIRRSPNRHLAFGYGIHFCLGAPLARLEAKITLEVMLKRLPGMRRVTEVPLEASESFILNGVKHLPITFERSR